MYKFLFLFRHSNIYTDGRGYDPDASIVSFAGFLPVEKPQFVCVIVVDDPRKERWGGSVAAPAFQRVMQRIVHLPGGLLADRPIAEHLVSTRVVPDLRGMTRSAAHLTAQLRGIEVRAEGHGSVVVGQVPLVIIRECYVIVGLVSKMLPVSFL